MIRYEHISAGYDGTAVVRDFSLDARPGAMRNSHSPARTASASIQPMVSSKFVEFLVVIIPEVR